MAGPVQTMVGLGCGIAITGRPGPRRRDGRPRFPGDPPGQHDDAQAGQEGEEPRQLGQPRRDLAPARRAVAGPGRVDHPGHGVPDHRVGAPDPRLAGEAADVGGRAGRVVAGHEAQRRRAWAGGLQQQQEPGVGAAVGGVEVGHVAVAKAKLRDEAVERRDVMCAPQGRAFGEDVRVGEGAAQAGGRFRRRGSLRRPAACGRSSWRTPGKPETARLRPPPRRSRAVSPVSHRGCAGACRDRRGGRG